MIKSLVAWAKVVRKVNNYLCKNTLLSLLFATFYDIILLFMIGGIFVTVDGIFGLIKKTIDVLLVWMIFYYVLKNLRRNGKLLSNSVL